MSTSSPPTISTSATHTPPDREPLSTITHTDDHHHHLLTWPAEFEDPLSQLDSWSQDCGADDNRGDELWDHLMILSDDIDVCPILDSLFY